MPKRKVNLKWSKWRKLGSIMLDTATIMFCDPCRAIGEDAPLRKRFKKWHDYCEAMDKTPIWPELSEPITPESIKAWQDSIKKLRRKKPAEHSTIGDHKNGSDAICVTTRSDGCFDIEMRSRGSGGLGEREIRIRL